MNLLSFIKPILIEEVYSPISGTIKVIEFFGEKKIEVGGLTQSSPFIAHLWSHAIRKIKNQSIRQDQDKQSKIKNILILGLGGGSVIKILRNRYPEAHIVGVEIDPKMVELGKKYLGFNIYYNLEIKIEDAITYVNKQQTTNNKQLFDLIIVDLYEGYEIPEKSESEKFIKNLYSILPLHGIIIINRIYFRTYKNLTNLFLDKLKKMFHDVSAYHYLSNLFIYINKDI